MNKQPSIWYEHWGGNNFKWDNNFKKEFRIDVGTAFRYPDRKTEVKFNYAIIKNYADFGFDCTSFTIFRCTCLVAAFTIKNELRAWKFHLASDVIIQKSSNISEFSIFHLLQYVLLPILNIFSDLKKPVEN